MLEDPTRGFHFDNPENESNPRVWTVIVCPKRWGLAESLPFVLRDMASLWYPLVNIQKNMENHHF
jgi:hypothetical protein